MISHGTAGEPARAAAAATSTCPRWCVTTHGAHMGEEDWIHTSAPVMVVEGLPALMCISVDPETGVQDGPYVLIGNSELTTDEAVAIGESLIRLATVYEEAANRHGRFNSIDDPQ